MNGKIWLSRVSGTNVMKLTPAFLRLVTILPANSVFISKPPLSSCFPSAALHSGIDFSGDCEVKNFSERRNFFDVCALNNLVHGSFLQFFAYRAICSGARPRKIINPARDAFVHFQYTSMNRDRPGTVIPKVE